MTSALIESPEAGPLLRRPRRAALRRQPRDPHLRAAEEHDISLRTGCFCNPGAGEVAFSISNERLAERFVARTSFDGYIERVGMPTGGAVRASLGIASTFADVYRFMAFATEFADLTAVPPDLPPRLAC